MRIYTLIYQTGFLKACRFFAPIGEKLSLIRGVNLFSRAQIKSLTTKCSGFRGCLVIGSVRKTGSKTKKTKTISDFSLAYAYPVRTENCRFFAFIRQISIIFRIKPTLLDELRSTEIWASNYAQFSVYSRTKIDTPKKNPS